MSVFLIFQQLGEVIELANKVFGNHADASAWLYKPSDDFMGDSPIKACLNGRSDRVKEILIKNTNAL
jgi:uncharacterized protein (DUF2384 family)